MKSVCVYCGSSFGADPAFAEAAEETGKLIAAAGMTLVYGGGSVGLMGVVARAAFRAGAPVVGIIPAFLRYAEMPAEEVTELHIVDSMHARKAMMFDRSDAFLALPGGIGTLDETIEMMTWAQLNRHAKPILMINVKNYWASFEALMKAIVAAEFAKPELANLYRVVDGPGTAINLLLQAPKAGA